MNHKPVVIFGTGTFAEMAAVYLNRDSPRDVLAFTVDGQYANAHRFHGLPLIAFDELLESHPPDRVDLLVAIGYSQVNGIRQSVYERCGDLGYGFVTYVSSKACVMSDEDIGENTFIFEASVIQQAVTIGNDVIVWAGSHIGHHSRIEDHCFIAPCAAISGNVVVRERSFVGLNATLRDGITVGRKCVIGAGAVVLRDQEDGTVLGSTTTAAHPRKSWELRNI
jgi:sugar O-acyltransferase (sialic acid O-acetyltransferase NeuD family)